MKDSVFREYDIRGVVGNELSLDQVYALTRAILVYFKQCNPSLATIVIGMDGRTHSPLIKEEVIRAVMDTGLRLVDIGLCPSPVLYFTLHELKLDAGLMITASHNPKEYNGLKICLGTESVWGTQIQQIKELYKEKASYTSEIKGSIEHYDAISPYIAWLKNHFADLVGLSMPIVFDCGNGATGAVVPRLVEAMEWKNARLLCCTVDGTYPHHEADPTVEQNMQEIKQVLATTDAEIGIGFDGDGDRMAAMTKDGFLVPGDQLLALFAVHMLATYPKASVVFDVKASSGLVKLLEQHHAKPIMSACGHAIVKDELKKHKALLGGELSCHFFFKDRHFGFDDGIYAALRLIELIKESDTPLDRLLTIFPQTYSSPEMRIPCSEEDKHAIVAYVKNQLSKLPGVKLITIDGVRTTFSDGWGLLRASNTQPVLSLRFEADTPQRLEEIKNMFLKMIKAYYAQ